MSFRRRFAFRLEPGLVGLLVAILLVPSVAGCGGKKQTSDQPSAPEKTAEELEAERQERRNDQVKAYIAQVERFIRQNPGEYWQIRQKLDVAKFNAQDTPYVGKVDDLIERNERDIQSWAEKEFEAVSKRIEPMIEEADFAGALEELAVIGNEENARFFRETDIWDDWQQKYREVETMELAEKDYNFVTSRALAYKRQLELAKAIGLLVSYPDKYKDTKYYPEVQELIEAFFTEYKAEKAEKDKITAIPFKPVDLGEGWGDLVPYGPDGEDVWTVESAEISGKNPGGERPWPLVLGDETWVEWAVEFDFKYEGGDALRFGLSQGQRFSQVDYNPYRIPDVDEGEWIRIRVERTEGLIKIWNVTAKAPVLDPFPPDYATGPFSFWCSPDQEVQIRDIQFKIIEATKKPDEGDEGDDEDQ